MAHRSHNGRLVIAAIAVLAVGGCILHVRGCSHEMYHRIDLGERLQYAVSSGDISTARRLLEQGADPNYRGEGNILLEAIKSGDQRSIKLLTGFGVNPSLALFDVPIGGVSEAEALLNLGADPNARLGDEGWSPVWEHCVLGNIEVARFLVAHGGDPRGHDERGYNLLECVRYAAGNHPESRAGYQAVIEMLTKPPIRAQQRVPGE